MEIIKQKRKRVGLGTYRMSIRSNEHRQALIAAIRTGCKIIDTASNYTDGEAEQLIGNTLTEEQKRDITIITKAGFIEGQIVEDLENKQLLSHFEIFKRDDNSYYSLDPQYLRYQINQSQQRLKTNKIDLFLLQNPEQLIEHQACSLEELYKKIEKALLELEKLVNENIIGGYGISSNSFVKERSAPDFLDLEKIIEILDSNSLTNFHAIEFPFNFLEIGAMEPQFAGKNLFQLAEENSILTITNRSINAFTEQGLLRIAQYDMHTPAISKEDAITHFESAMQIVERKYFARLQEEGEEVKEETIWEIPFFEQFRKIWLQLPTPDAVEQVYYQHFFPLLAQIWGGDGVPPEESEPFFALFDISLNFARQNMHTKAEIFHKQAVEAGLIDKNEKQDLVLIACENYLRMGADFVLLGARRVSYVEQVKELFTPHL